MHILVEIPMSYSIKIELNILFTPFTFFKGGTTHKYQSLFWGITGIFWQN